MLIVVIIIIGMLEITCFLLLNGILLRKKLTFWHKTTLLDGQENL